jgi:hypothetical protein
MLHKIYLEIKKFLHFLENRNNQKKVMIFTTEFSHQLFKNYGRLEILTKKIILSGIKKNQ